jgi:hypothetical protein
VLLQRMCVGSRARTSQGGSSSVISGVKIWRRVEAWNSVQAPMKPAGRWKREQGRSRKGFGLWWFGGTRGHTGNLL